MDPAPLRSTAAPKQGQLSTAGAIGLVFLPFVSGYYLSYLYRTITALISDGLARDLGLSSSDLGLLASMYFLALGLVQLPLGVWLDQYGPRRVQAVLMAVAAAGALMFALADGFAALLVARTLIGLVTHATLRASTTNPKMMNGSSILNVLTRREDISLDRSMTEDLPL